MDTATFEKYGLKPLEPLLETDQITMWKMAQPAINRTVLVHVLGKSMAADPAAVSYLFSVVRSISNSSAPAIAQVYTIFDEPDLKAVVSEYVDGLSLDKAISALGPLSIKQTVRTGIAVAEALKNVWDSFHIVYGAVHPEFITLDAGATAKIVSPCYAHVAAADQEVPTADMADLGELLYFLATGVRPGQAHSVNLPPEFTVFLEKLSSDSPMTRYASWDSVIGALRLLENLNPEGAAPAAAAAPAAPAGGGEGGKKLAVKRSFGAPTGKVPKAVKRDGPAKPAAIASRLAMDKPAAQKGGSAKGGGSKGSGTKGLGVRLVSIKGVEAGVKSAMDAVRKAARDRAIVADQHSSGRGAQILAFVMLMVVLACIFVMRVGHAEFKDRITRNWRESLQPGSQQTQTVPISVDDTPAPVTAAPASAPRPSAPAPVASSSPAPAAAPAASASSSNEEDDFDSLLSQMDDSGAALNRYLAAHVGGEVPFIHKGVEHKVTLVSYTATTVTIRTRKTLTINRSELTKGQLELWK